MNDLWPKEIILDEGETVLSVLRSQAELLGQRLNNIVTAKVFTEFTRGHGDLVELTTPLGEISIVEAQPLFAHSFTIEAPLLENYRYELFLVIHGLEPFPAYLRVDIDILKELRQEEQKFLQVHDHAELNRLLSRILSAKKTRKVISSLYQQSQAIEEKVPF